MFGAEKVMPLNILVYSFPDTHDCKAEKVFTPETAAS